MEPTLNSEVKTTANDELSLKELILKAREWAQFILRNWLWIAIFGLIGASVGFIYAFVKRPAYTAELTFVLEDSKTGALSSYAGLASQLGIDIAGASGSGVFSGDNILEFLKSRLMVQRALLSSAKIYGKSTTLADFYITISGLKNKWKSTPGIKDVEFPINVDRKRFSLQQDSALNIVYQHIIANALVIAKPDKKLSFISVKCMSKDQFFSKFFIEKLVKEATDFYVLTKTQRSKANVDKLQQKADSIENLLNKKTYSVAASQDLNLNPARSIARVNTELVTRDKIVLQTMYSEVVKNLEMSKMAMVQETPIIQVIDIPILPLKSEKLGKIKAFVIGGLLGGFLTMLILVIKQFYKELVEQ